MTPLQPDTVLPHAGFASPHLPYSQRQALTQAARQRASALRQQAWADGLEALAGGLRALSRPLWPSIWSQLSGRRPPPASTRLEV